MLEVPHLYITLTTDDSFRPFFCRDSRLLKELLRLGAQAVQEVLSDLYPGMQMDWSTLSIPSAVTWGISRMSIW